MEFLADSKPVSGSDNRQRFIDRIACLRRSGDTERATYIADAMRFLFGLPENVRRHAGASAGLI